MMLEHLGEFDAAQSILYTIRSITAERTLRTPDLGGVGNDDRDRRCSRRENSDAAERVPLAHKANPFP